MAQTKENKGKAISICKKFFKEMIYVVSEVTDSRDIFRLHKPHALGIHRGIPYGVEMPGVRPIPE